MASMDFDTMTRELATGTTRRRTLATLGALVLAGAGVLPGALSAEAKSKVKRSGQHHNNHKGKHKRSGHNHNNHKGKNRHGDGGGDGGGGGGDQPIIAPPTTTTPAPVKQPPTTTTPAPVPQPTASQNCRMVFDQCGSGAGVRGTCRLAAAPDKQDGLLCTSNTAGNPCTASTQCSAGTRCVIEGLSQTCRVVIA